MSLRSSPRSLLLALLLALAALLTALPAWAGAPRVIPPGREQMVQDLIADVGYMRDLGGGYRFDRIRIIGDEVFYVLSREGVQAGELRLLPAKSAAPGDEITKSFAVRRRVIGDEREVAPLLQAAARSVQAHDDARLYVDATDAPPPTGIRGAISMLDRPSDLPRFALWSVAAAAVLLAAVTTALRRRRPEMVVFDFKPAHAIPAVVQSTIFAYWALYWAPLRAYLVLVAVELAFAFVADAAISLWTRRRLVIGLAPLPIVFSINLFVQFPGRALYMPLAAILLAFLSKAYLRRKDGHIFNPSAFGVTVVAFVHLLFPQIGNGDVAFKFALPPNMTELMMVLALLPQTRRPIVLISIFTALAMHWYEIATGFRYFYPFWAPVFLSIALLATDPATMPRTGPGRVVFGTTLGFGFMFAATVLDLQTGSDFYGKVIALPFVNLLTPWCDRVGTRLGEAMQRALSPENNAQHIVLWLFLCLVGLGPYQKASGFEPDQHAQDDTPLIQRDANGAIRCETNPIFCEPFSFAGEIAAWIRRASRPAP